MTFFARKVRAIPEAPRPRMDLIDVSTLVAGEDATTGYEEFPAVLAGAAERLHRI